MTEKLKFLTKCNEVFNAIPESGEPVKFRTLHASLGKMSKTTSQKCLRRLVDLGYVERTEQTDRPGKPVWYSKLPYKNIFSTSDKRLSWTKNEIRDIYSSVLKGSDFAKDSYDSVQYINLCTELSIIFEKLITGLYEYSNGSKNQRHQNFEMFLEVVLLPSLLLDITKIVSTPMSKETVESLLSVFYMPDSVYDNYPDE